MPKVTAPKDSDTVDVKLGRFYTLKLNITGIKHFDSDTGNWQVTVGNPAERVEDHQGWKPDEFELTVTDNGYCSWKIAND